LREVEQPGFGCCSRGLAHPGPAGMSGGPRCVSSTEAGAILAGEKRERSRMVGGGEVEGWHARLPSSQRVERSRSRSRGGAERERGVWRRDEMRICRCQLLTPEKFPGSHGAQRGCPMKSIAATWPRTYNPLPLPPPPAPAPAPTPRRPLADLAR